MKIQIPEELYKALPHGFVPKNLFPYYKREFQRQVLAKLIQNDRLRLAECEPTCYNIKRAVDSGIKTGYRLGYFDKKTEALFRNSKSWGQLVMDEVIRIWKTDKLTIVFK